MSIEIASLIITIILAFVGYLFTYWYSLRLSERQERLNLLNKQINEFYGPLYISTKTGSIAYRSLLRKLGIERMFDPDKPPNECQLQEWRLWVQHVFMPINEYREKLILENAHLIREEEMPECLLQYVTHVSAYKAMIQKWQNNDFSEVKPLIAFPIDVDRYASDSYRELKSQQIKLIGQRRK